MPTQGEYDMPPRDSGPGLRGMTFHTRRVRVHVRREGPVYTVEKRDYWWPFWRRENREVYADRNAAIAAAEASLTVGNYLHRTVHEPDVIWRG